MKRYNKKTKILNLFRKTINGWDVRFDLWLARKGKRLGGWPPYFYTHEENTMKKFDLYCLPLIGFTYYMYKEKQ